MAMSLERVDFEEHQRETFKLNKMQFQLRYYWRIDDRTMEWAAKQRYLPLINKRNSTFIESLLNSTVGLFFINYSIFIIIYHKSTLNENVNEDTFMKELHD